MRSANRVILHLLAACALTGCAYQGPRGEYEPAPAPASAGEKDSPVVRLQPCRDSLDCSFPLRLRVPDDLLANDNGRHRKCRVAVYSPDGRLLLSARIPPVYLPTLQSAVMEIPIPMADPARSCPDGAGAEELLDALMSLQFGDDEPAWIRVNGLFLRDSWAPGPRIDSRSRTIGALLYPLYGLPRDMADAPLTAWNRLIAGEAPYKRVGHVSADPTNPVGVVAMVAGIFAYSYVVVPVQVALLRTGIDESFLKFDPVRVSLVDGQWSLLALYEVEELDRSLAFFPNWKFAAHERTYAAGPPDQPLWRLLDFTLTRLPPAARIDRLAWPPSNVGTSAP